jgi:hypothetical protein
VTWLALAARGPFDVADTNNYRWTRRTLTGLAVRLTEQVPSMTDGQHWTMDIEAARELASVVPTHDAGDAQTGGGR